MRTQRRNKRPIYLCQRYVDDKGLIKYKEPIKVMENYNNKKIETDLIAMGMEYENRLKIKADNRVKVGRTWMNRADLYHVGDRVYVFTTPPKTHDVLCKTADYEVEKEPIATATINQIEITLIKLSGKNNNKS